KELAQYLATSVDEWAVHNWGLRQQPVLLGTGPTFDLIAVTERKAPPALPVLVEKGKEKGQAKEKEKKEAGKEQEPSTPTGPVYPKWLAEGWGERDGWWQSNDLLTAPRAFRMLEAALIEAEHDWRGGGDPAEVRR